MSDQSRRDDLDQRLDAALDALASGQAPPRIDDAYDQLVDTARVVRRLREPDVPDQEFAGRLADYLGAELDAESLNGRVSGEGIVPLETRRMRSRRARLLLTPLAALLRLLGAGLIAGVLVGLVTIGIGSRVAMRISGALYLREHPNAPVITDSSGQQVGVVTLSGTLDLFVQGMFAGAIGGLFYVIIRNWLPAGRWQRSLATGLLMFCITGVTFIDGDNQDFARIGIPWLNVLMFAAIVLAFGLLVAPLTESLIAGNLHVASRLSRRVRRLMPLSALYPAGAIGLLLSLMIIVPLSIMASLRLAVNVIDGASAREYIEMSFVWLAIVAIPVLSLLSARSSARGSRQEFARRFTPRATSLTSVGRLILVAVSAAGLVLLIDAIVRILSA